MTVKELREALAGLPDDTPVFRCDSEYGSQETREFNRAARVRNNPGDSYHWEHLSYNDFDEPGENQWLPVVLIR